MEIPPELSIWMWILVSTAILAAGIGLMLVLFFYIKYRTNTLSLKKPGISRKQGR